MCYTPGYQTDSMAISLDQLNLASSPAAPATTVAGLLTDGTSTFTLADGWAKLSQELKDKIIVHAMVSEADEIRLHCLTPYHSRANVALSLLTVNRATYCVAVRALYQKNQVVFTNFGSDLKLLFKGIYRNTRLSKTTLMRGSGPCFGHVTFDLGDPMNPAMAYGKLSAFTYALMSLANGFLLINHLKINLLGFSFEYDIDLHFFTEQLHKVRITSSFTLEGMAHHLELPVREFASELQMNPQPIDSTFIEANFRVHTGYFKDVYVVAQPQHATVGAADIQDASSSYEQWKTANSQG